MSLIQFDKSRLQDLDFSLTREWLLANSAGAYASSSLLNCNTRKYHGLLVVPQPYIDDNNYVLLSSLDETIIDGSESFLLGVHRYPNTYYPEGYKYPEEFSDEKSPTWLIKANNVVLEKEILLPEADERVLIRYTVKEADKPFIFRFEPFLAFRNIHALTHANIHANHKYKNIPNGIKIKLYDGFSELHIQFSHKVGFVPAPTWHYNVEYLREQERGYDFTEDLYRPGYFDIQLKKGDHIVFSAGTSEISPRKLTVLFEKEIRKRAPLDTFEDCLENAAQQFIVARAKKTYVTAGFHWFGPWGRDTFIALPGLTLSLGKPQVCKAALKSMLKDLKNGLFPNTGAGENAAYNSADASLWFIWALQQYAAYTGTTAQIWKEFGAKIKSILEHYRNGTLHGIHMLESGLLYAGENGVAVTWMDAVVDGKPVTPRIGLTVELNALWFNAVEFALEMARAANNKKFIDDWKEAPERLKLAFTEAFWNEEKGYLADYVDNYYREWSLRPNQIFAISLPYSPITDEGIKLSIVEAVKKHLLTPRGLRTLSPESEDYQGTYGGDRRSRDLAYHQGTVWPWLLGHFAEAYIKIYGDEGKQFVRSLYENFAPAVEEYGIGTIAEIYDGDAPHKACGAISQAWSVAELLRIREMLSAKTPASKRIRKEQAPVRPVPEKIEEEVAL